MTSFFVGLDVRESLIKCCKPLCLTTAADRQNIISFLQTEIFDVVRRSFFGSTNAIRNIFRHAAVFFRGIFF